MKIYIIWLVGVIIYYMAMDNMELWLPICKAYWRCYRGYNFITNELLA